MAITGDAAGNRRKELTADVTYYIRTDGDDDNTGLANNANEAWQTLEKAANVLNNEISIGEHKVTVQVADGTYIDYGYYEASLYLRNIEGEVEILGNTTNPENVKINAEYYGFAFQIENCPNVTIRGFQVRDYTSSGYGAFFVDRYSLVRFGNIRIHGDGVPIDVFGGMICSNHSEAFGDWPMTVGDIDTNLECIWFADRYSTIKQPSTMTVEAGETVTLDEWARGQRNSTIQADTTTLGAGASVVGKRFVLRDHSRFEATNTGVFDIDQLPGDEDGTLDGTCSYNGKTLSNYNNSDTITANRTIIAADHIPLKTASRVQVLTNTTSVLDFTLPDSGSILPLEEYIVVNRAASTFDILVKNAAGTLKTTVAPGGQSGLVWDNADNDWVVI